MMLPKDRLYLAPLFVLWTALTGCTVTATTGPSSTCSADSTVVGCVGGAQGYSCSGLDSPDQSNTALNCSPGTLTAGDTLYCCIDDSAVSSACSVDSSVVGCTGASLGFSCSSGRPDTNDTSLVCSSGTPIATGGDAFCCVSYVPSSSCTEDTTVSCPTSIGFSCIGGTSPDQENSALSCGAGVPGSAAGSTAYCCSAGSTTPVTSGCMTDSAVACAAPTVGYSCTGGVMPIAADATMLSCGAGANEGNGSLGYCCNPEGSTTTDTCAPDSTVTGCGTGGTGYSCTGTATPSSVAPVLCEPPTTGATATDYCCYAAAGSTCAADPTVTGCAAGSSGFTCTGADSPETDTNMALLCGMGTGGAGGTPYCCTSN
jgi:hypothetical protein